MASTEQHTGVRFPWVRTAQPSDAEPDADSSEAIASQAGEPAETDDMQEGEGLVGHLDSPDGRSPDGNPAAWTPSSESAVATSQAPVAAHRPSRFLGELVRAMLTAAQEARTTAVEQVHADAKTHIELIHARSADRATELKRQADDDNAATREWSKAEMARIREETEQRIAARKEALAADLERHAARIEAEIDQVQKRVAAFEQEVEAFFARLSDASDPTQLAMLAEQMPDPPQFEDAVSAAPEAVHDVPGQAAPYEAEPEAVAAGPYSTEIEDEPPAAIATAGAEESVAAVDASAEAVTPQGEAEVAAGEVEPQGEAEVVAEEEAPQAEAVAEAEAPQAEGELATGAEEPGAEAEGPDAVESPELETSEEGVASAADAERLATVEAADSDDVAGSESAGETADGQDDAGPAARLASLMSALPRAGDMGGGQRASDSAGPSVNSIVTVVGLVSVAGIASFKRQLSHVPGVFNVGVSSSPDGEFVFRVAHDPVVVLRDVVPTLPGFAARVIKEADGRLSISAHDPTNDA